MCANPRQRSSDVFREKGSGEREQAAVSAPRPLRVLLPDSFQPHTPGPPAPGDTPEAVLAPPEPSCPKLSVCRHGSQPGSSCPVPHALPAPPCPAPHALPHCRGQPAGQWEEVSA